MAKKKKHPDEAQRGRESLHVQHEHASKYPECEKLSKAGATRRAINNFLEHLREKGIWLCERSPGSNFDEYYPVTTSDDNLTLGYLEIDPVKLEEERRAMLDALREQAGE